MIGAADGIMNGSVHRTTNGIMNGSAHRTTNGTVNGITKGTLKGSTDGATRWTANGQKASRDCSIGSNGMSGTNGTNESVEVERRVIVISTGGTICMVKSPDGLIPNRNFLANAMIPRPELNDGLKHDPIEVRVNDCEPPRKIDSLRTPCSTYGKQIRYVASKFLPDHFEIRIQPYIG